MITDAQRTHRMMAEILADIDAGIVPVDVPTYSALHDYVDANGYGGFFDEDLDEEHVDQFNRCSNRIDSWLRKRCERLAHGLFLEKAPALPKGYQVKCIHCGCSVPDDHEPWSPECYEARIEREIGHSDE